MKNLFGFILFIFLCYWALKGCSGNTSKVIDDIKVTQPEVVIDTTHSSEDACGEGDIPINQPHTIDVTFENSGNSNITISSFNCPSWIINNSPLPITIPPFTTINIPFILTPSIFESSGAKIQFSLKGINFLVAVFE